MEQKQKRKALATGILLLVLCLGIGAGAYFRSNFLVLSGEVYARELRSLTLSRPLPEDLSPFTRFRGLQQLDLRPITVTPEEHEALRLLLPECDILWELPFQGRNLPLDTRSLTISTLTREETALLDYLPELSSVYAWECRDYDALLALQTRRPDCKVFYNVEIGGTLYDCETTALSLEDAESLDLEWLLTGFPRLRDVRFTGDLPTVERLALLAEQFPEVRFTWEVTLGEATADSGDQTLVLPGGSGLPLSRLDQLLRYLPALTTLDLGAIDQPEEALLALERGHPGLTILWDMEILGKRFPRGAAEVDLTGIPVTDVAALEERLGMMPGLERVILSDCGLSSPEMDELDRRHPDIRFIWTVNLGGIPVRTDATWFCPNKYYIKVTDSDLEDLRYCYDMVCIDIGHNRGVTHCQWAANMPQLRYLVIADTNIKDLSPLAGLENLVFLEVFTSPVRDYTPLLQCPGLEDLNLGYTYGDPTPVIGMTWLKRLWWPGSLRVLTWNVRNQLRTALPDAKMNFVAGSSTGEGWRAGEHYYAMRDLMGMPYMTG